jgi:hypothetical protein
VAPLAIYLPSRLLFDGNEQQVRPMSGSASFAREGWNMSLSLAFSPAAHHTAAVAVSHQA